MIIKSDNEVSIQKRSNNNYSYYFIMNFSEKEKNVELKSELFDMLINTHISSIIKLKPYEVKVLKASKI
ncbi:Beta-galactosidase C-terminal domain [Thomasclavelia sp.]|uniref:Beta-galactosidase C-terminal domain n=1 Tax=Thomasclavelia sp. TaxID=3025757 RepID=UPI00344488C3